MKTTTLRGELEEVGEAGIEKLEGDDDRTKSLLQYRADSC
jgi:hypothetical protein